MVSIYFCIVALFVLHQTFFVTGEIDCTPQWKDFFNCRSKHHSIIAANLTRDFNFDVFWGRLKPCFGDFPIIPYENSTVQLSADRDNLLKRRNCIRDNYISQRSTLQANFQARGLDFSQLVNVEEPFTDLGQNFYKYPSLAQNYYYNANTGKGNKTCIRLALIGFNEGSCRNVVAKAGSGYCNYRQRECYKSLPSTVCRIKYNNFIKSYFNCTPNVTSTECGFNKSPALRKAYDREYSCGVIPPNPADLSTRAPEVQVAAAVAVTKAAVAGNIAAQSGSSNTGVVGSSTGDGTKTNTSATGTATISNSGSGDSNQATTQKSNVGGSATDVKSTSNPSGGAAANNQGATTIKANQVAGSGVSTSKPAGDTGSISTVKAGGTVGTNVNQGQTGAYQSITTVKAGDGGSSSNLAASTVKPNAQATQGQNTATQYSTAKPSGGDGTTVKVTGSGQITTARFGEAAPTKNNALGVTNGGATNSVYSTTKAANTGQQITTTGFAAATPTKNGVLGVTSTGNYGSSTNTTPKLSQGTGYPSVTNGALNSTTTKPSATTQKAG